MQVKWFVPLFLGLLPAFQLGSAPVWQQVPSSGLQVRFEPAPRLSFPNPTDSNSPAVWIGDEFYIFNSFGGTPRRAVGSSLQEAADDQDDDGQSFIYNQDIGVGRWLESVIRNDDTGRLYGFYHAEVLSVCPRTDDSQPLNGSLDPMYRDLFWPEIGEVISDDNGLHWDNLGIILGPAPDSVTCDTDHPVTSGGVGDFSVIVDRNDATPADHWVYFLFSNYGGPLDEQGVGMARMLYLDLDCPISARTGQSRAVKWYQGAWAEDGLAGHSSGLFSDYSKISWTQINNSGYWGPSIHWNVDLGEFIVLMNRSRGGDYVSAGIFASAIKNLSDPSLWSLPIKVIEPDGFGMWYPQVIGDAAIHGTDKLSGRRARYFNQGTSDQYIVFSTQPPIRVGDR